MFVRTGVTAFSKVAVCGGEAGSLEIAADKTTAAKAAKTQLAPRRIPLPLRNRVD
jgi:hypothetical protein